MHHYFGGEDPGSPGRIRMQEAIERAGEGPTADGGGLRYDDDKNHLELNPPEWAWALGTVSTRGSYKYEERNWERGMKWATMIGCASRHILKFVCGQKYDEETGCHHLAMAAWNCLALMTYDLRGIGEDNMSSSYLAILDKTALPIPAALQAIRDSRKGT